jgi:3-hydroxybutyrate dehydrogenase
VKDGISHFGSIDILVNNAGKQFTSPIESFPDNTW